MTLEKPSHSRTFPVMGTNRTGRTRCSAYRSPRRVITTRLWYVLPHRDHQAPAVLELRLERLGDPRRGGGDDDGVEGRGLRPAR